MNDLWVHYSGDLDPGMDSQILDIMKVNGGKWFGSGVSLKDPLEGRDSSFTFNRQGDLENAVGGLNRAFSLEFMRTTGDEGHYSYHYRVK